MTHILTTLNLLALVFYGYATAVLVINGPHSEWGPMVYVVYGILSTVLLVWSLFTVANTER